ncbi:AMP-binding protein [Kitasatospora aburaviensis]
MAYSRGTTGPRRGAVHRFAAMNVVWRRPHEGELGDFPAGVTTLAVSPLAGNGGEVALMLMRAGCTVMLMNGFDAGRVLATVAAERITSTYLPAHRFTELVAHPDLDRTDLSSLRYLPYGNGPVPASVVRRAVAAFGPILSQNYVSSEIRAISLLRQEDHRAAAGPRPELLASVGQPLPAVDVRVCGPDGERRPAGRSGEIRLRAPHMMSGYWRDPAATAGAGRRLAAHRGRRPGRPRVPLPGGPPAGVSAAARAGGEAKEPEEPGRLLGLLRGAGAGVPRQAFSRAKVRVPT